MTEEHPINSFDDFVAFMKRIINSPMRQHTTTLTIQEETPKKLTLCTTECLRAKIFKEMNATDLGYLIFCHQDSKTANSIALDELLTKKLRQKGSRRADLLIRLMGFFLIGGLLWEASESFVFPLFGYAPEPFFSFPITLGNIDGMIDVVVGVVGCFAAWYLAKLRLSHGNR